VASAAKDRVIEADVDEVVGWRTDELRRAGYRDRAAQILARHTEVDLHLAVALIARGCPQRTALRILL
jgi:hypothetical protein